MKLNTGKINLLLYPLLTKHTHINFI